MPEVQRVHHPDLDRRVRIYRCGSLVDSFAVLTERFAVIVDTLIGEDAMRAVLADLMPSLAGRQLLAVNTHGDWDHVWGNGLFVGRHAEQPAPVIGHEGIAARMRTAEAETVLREKQAEDAAYATAAWHPPTIALAGGARIDGGDLSLYLLPTPGHTSDHLSVWIPEIRLLLAGDAAEWPFPEADHSLSDLRSSLRRLLALDPQTVLYCHAAGRIDAGIIEENIAYFDELERRTREGSDWPAAEAVPGNLDTALDRSMYESFHDRNTAAMRDWLLRR